MSRLSNIAIGCGTCAGLAVCGLLCLGIFSRNLEREDARVEKQFRDKLAAIPRSQYVSTAIIAGQYDANAILADELFRSKLTPLFGVVSSIDRDVSGVPYLVLDPGVQCVFPKESRSLLASLRKGQRVYIAGIGAGRTPYPAFTDCRLLPAPKR